MLLSSWWGHCKSSPASFSEYRLSARWPPTLRPSQPTWTLETASKGCSHHHPPSPFVIITQPESRYSFAVPRRVHGRLSRARHCSESVQPMPRLYYRDCCDQHKCRQLRQQGREWHLISWEDVSHSILLAMPLHTTKWLTSTRSSPTAFSLSLCWPHPHADFCLPHFRHIFSVMLNHLSLYRPFQRSRESSQSSVWVWTITFELNNVWCRYMARWFISKLSGWSNLASG